MSIGEEAAKGEVTGSAIGRKNAVVCHLRHVVAADRNVESDFAIGAHQRKLVCIALVVEKLREVGLVTFHVSDMDERDSLSKMPRSIGERLDRINRIDRIIINAEAQRRRVRGEICIWYL